MMIKSDKKLSFVGPRSGSALVLVIVITVLLATVGVMFVVMARVGQAATSAISDNHELAGAVDVVVNRIQTILVDDLFGGDDKMFNGGGDDDSPAPGDEDEYYDYPGPDDPWLASLEPVQDILSPSGYSWPHISNVSQYPVDFGFLWAQIAEPDADANDFWQPDGVADADGDGVEDSRWARLPVTSSKGKPIFAAVRIIDNCGMININTAYQDPTDSIDPCDWPDWDGSLLTHINLDTDRIHNNYVPNSYYGFVSFQDSGNNLSTAQLHQARCGVLPPVSDVDYHNYVARRLLNPLPGYTPFDIGDELEFRNRFFLFSQTKTRSGTVWPATFNPGDGIVGVHIPYDTPADLPNWFDKATSPEKPIPPPVPPQPQNRICNRRHIATTYSFDRIIRPYDDTPLPGDMLPTSGQRKFGIQLPPNLVDGATTPAEEAEKEQYIQQLAGAIYRGLPGNSEIADRFGPGYTREKLAWQFAVNLIDYQDDDQVVGNSDDDEPTYYNAAGVGEFWGVENVECIKRDTIFISEVAYVNNTTGPPPPPGDYYAIELFNPNTGQKDPFSTQNYYITIAGGPPVSLNNAGVPQLGSEGAVILSIASTVDTTNAFSGMIYPSPVVQVPSLIFSDGDEIVIYKEDWPVPGADMPVDRIRVPPGIVTGTNQINIRRRDKTLGPVSDNLLWTNLWTDSSGIPNTLGSPPTPPDLFESDPNVQLTVTNESLITIGEIENVFAVGYDPNHTLIGSIKEAYKLIPIPELNLASYGRINLADPNYWPLLDSLTCFDPSSDLVDNDGRNGPDDNRELAIAGRININTAPWFVIKHLPWVGLTTAGTDTDKLAQAIVAWRDKFSLATLLEPTLPNYSGLNGRANGTGLSEISEEPGFRNIGELLQVINTSGALEFDIRKYLDGVNNGSSPVSPDYTGDITDDDFEERDIIFQRISNLVTVRSDVFTAYILVRIGHDGPQKRMIAIFDRSNVFSAADTPRLVALHPVPDPR